MKRCPSCPEPEKPRAEFGLSDHTPDGFRTYCKRCDAERAAAYRAKQVAKRRTQTQAPELGEEARTDPGLPGDFEITECPPEAVQNATRPPETARPEASTHADDNPLAAAYQGHAERKDVRETKRQRDALLDENAHLKRQLAEVFALRRPPDALVYREAPWVRADAVACAVASDWHVEEPVDGAAVHGLNEYSPEIARSRSEHFFRNLLRLANITARDSTVRSIHLSLLGDFFSGYIHDELTATNEMAPGDAAHFVVGLLASGIDFLLRESSFVIEGDCVPGNHGRMTKQVWFGDPTGTSLETFLYRALCQRYDGNERVRLNVSEHAMVYRRFFEKFRMRLIHGYEVKYGGGVGGITVPLRKALAQWNNPIRADLTVLGHFHQLFDGGDFLVNGSLIGYNTYAQAIKASFEEPRQAFFLVHARNGGTKSITAPIWLDDAHAQEPAPA